MDGSGRAFEPALQTTAPKMKPEPAYAFPQLADLFRLERSSRLDGWPCVRVVRPNVIRNFCYCYHLPGFWLLAHWTMAPPASCGASKMAAWAAPGTMCSCEPLILACIIWATSNE